MGSCRCVNGAGALSTTVLPNTGGPWTIGCWIKANPGEYTGSTENIAFTIGNNAGASSQGICYIVGPIGGVTGSSNSTATALQYTSGGGTLVGQIMLTGRDMRWNFFSVAHPAAGTVNYQYRYGAEDAATFNSFNQTVAIELSFAVGGAGGIFLGTSQFTENTLDSCLRSFWMVNRYVADGELFQISRNLDVPPADAIHWLPLSNPVGRQVNYGSAGGSFTVAAGSMTFDSSEPVFQEPINMGMNF